MTDKSFFILWSGRPICGFCRLGGLLLRFCITRGPSGNVSRPRCRSFLLRICRIVLIFLRCGRPSGHCPASKTPNCTLFCCAFGDISKPQDTSPWKLWNFSAKSRPLRQSFPFWSWWEEDRVWGLSPIWIQSQYATFFLKYKAVNFQDACLQCQKSMW